VTQRADTPDGPPRPLVHRENVLSTRCIFNPMHYLRLCLSQYFNYYHPSVEPTITTTLRLYNHPFLQKSYLILVAKEGISQINRTRPDKRICPPHRQEPYSLLVIHCVRKLSCQREKMMNPQRARMRQDNQHYQMFCGPKGSYLQPHLPFGKWYRNREGR
jgi:hypothetical protein